MQIANSYPSRSARFPLMRLKWPPPPPSLLPFSLTACSPFHYCRTFLQMSHWSLLHHLSRHALPPQLSCVLPNPPTGSQLLCRSGILTFSSWPHCVSSGAAAFMFFYTSSCIHLFSSFCVLCVIFLRGYNSTTLSVFFIRGWNDRVALFIYKPVQFPLKSWWKG